MGYTLREFGYQLELVSDASEEMHLHPAAELIYVLGGTANVCESGREYLLREEDLIFLNSRRKHSLLTSADDLIFRVLVSDELLAGYLPQEHSFFRCNSAAEQNGHYETLRMLLRHLIDSFIRQPENPNFFMTSRFYSLMQCLEKDFLIDTADSPQIPGSSDRRYDQIADYIEANYRQHVSLEELADHLHLTYSYLSHYFKKTFEMNFGEYVNTVRLAHATEDLLGTGKSMTQIAVENGFGSQSAFNKVFKNAYGTTPLAYKKEKQNTDIQSRAQINSLDLQRRAAAWLRAQETSRDSGLVAFGKPRPVSINAQKYRPYRKSWLKMINIGNAQELLSARIQQQVLYLRDQLGFRYIRFDSVFSESLELRQDHSLQHLNFSKTDEILDFLIGHNLKPFIELGDKMNNIWTGTNRNIKPENPNLTFCTLEEYGDVLTQFAHHLVSRYRADEVSTWYFEAWNDDRVYRQGATEPVTYFQIFNKTSEILHRFIPDAKVGGCGIKGSDLQMRAFLDEWMAQPFRPDFLSIMSYPYDPVRESSGSISYTRRSADPRYLRHNILRARQIMEEAGMDCPLYVTEWNCTISDRNYINDSCHKGSWLIKNIIDAFELTDVLGYWIGSDLSGTYYDSRNILNGCCGLLTRDGICKPAFYAFQFLNRLGENLIRTGENYIATSSGDQSFYILCHNCRPLGRGYYENPEDSYTVPRIQDFSKNEPHLPLTFRLENIPDGVYSIKTFSISSSSGSILDEWARLDLAEEMRQIDIDYLSRICTPHIALRRIRSEDCSLSFDVDLQPEEFMLIHIYADA